MRFIVIGGGCYGKYHSGQLYKAVQKGKLPADIRLLLIDRNEHPAVKDLYGDKDCFEFVRSDWQTYLQNFFSDPALYNPATDGDTVQIVPAPFAPHLLFDWLESSTRNRLDELGCNNILIERDAFDEKMSLPYEHTDAKGNHYMSRAGWTCPTACIEPRLCPAVKAVRDWDLAEDVRAVASGGLVQPSVSAAERLATANKSNGTTTLLEPATHYAGVITFTCHHFSHGIGTVSARQLFESRETLTQAALALTTTNPVVRFAVGTVSHCHGVVATLKLSLI
jgi:hypothetical protein